MEEHPQCVSRPNANWRRRIFDRTKMPAVPATMISAMSCCQSMPTIYRKFGELQPDVFPKCFV